MKKLINVCLCTILAVSMIAGCGNGAPAGGVVQSTAADTVTTATATTEATTTAADTTTSAPEPETTTAAPEPETSTEAPTPVTTTAEPTEAVTEVATATTAVATTAEVKPKETGPAWGEGEGEGGGAGGGAGGGDSGAAVGTGAGTGAGPGIVAGAGNTAKPAFANPGNVDFSDAELPPEAVVFPDAQWNDMGYFLARAIGYVEMHPDPSQLPDNWPEDNKFFGVFFQVQCLDLIKESTTIDGYGFDFGGPGVQKVSLSVKPAGNTKSTLYPKEIGEIGYVNKCMTAEKLEDITTAWYKYSLKNEATDSYDYYIEYMQSMPFGNLIINDRPAGFDYNIPPSAVVCVGDWSDPGDDPAIKVRMLAYQEYPLLERELPDFMRLDDHLYLLYFEAENTGTEGLRYPSPYLRFGGRGVSDVIFFSSMAFTTYESAPSNLEPGERYCFYKIIYAGSISDLQSVTLGSKPNNVEIPLAF